MADANPFMRLITHALGVGNHKCVLTGSGLGGAFKSPRTGGATMTLPGMNAVLDEYLRLLSDGEPRTNKDVLEHFYKKFEMTG